MAEEIQKYPNAEVVWCQEEPKNGGAWQYCRPRIATASRDVRPLQPAYAGRAPAASTATGHGSWHTKELNELLAREQEGERELNAELQAKRDAQRQTMSAQRESMEELENENARLRAEVAEKRAQLLQQVSLNLELAEEVKRRA